jgi:2-dehydro-3-deoxyphosphogalactonate aldolase
MLPKIAPNGPVIVAILRGVVPENAGDIAQTLLDAGIRAIEIPLNSPDPFRSMETLAKLGVKDCVFGAGTVLATADVARVKTAGGKLVVAPNTDVDVIAAAIDNSLIPMPGFATATEAFAAVTAGARHLKLFPAQTYGTGHLKALKAVLPADVAVYAVGGVGADDIAEWWKAGVSGFGFGSELFKPSYSRKEIETRARRIVEAARAVQS